jgi:uncharacterized protein (DUF433 family)
MKLADVVTIDRELHSGVPCFVGTRIPIGTLINYLQNGHSVSEFVADHSIDEETVQNFFSYLEELFGEPTGYPHHQGEVVYANSDR